MIVLRGITRDQQALHLVAEVAAHLDHGVVRLLRQIPRGLEDQRKGPLLVGRCRL